MGTKSNIQWGKNFIKDTKEYKILSQVISEKMDWEFNFHLALKLFYIYIKKNDKSKPLCFCIMSL